jgi:hypothetical protein
VLHTNAITSFRQAAPDLATALAAADQGARLLSAFAQKLRQVAGPIAQEIQRITAQIEQQFGSLEDAPEDDPIVQRANLIGESFTIHVPQAEGLPFGRFPIELTNADLATLNRSRDAIADAISAVRGEAVSATNKRMVDRNAFPTFTGRNLIDESTRIENLVDLFNTDVTGRSRLKNVNVGVIIGGIAVGLIGLGVISYATRPRKAKRR